MQTKLLAAAVLAVSTLSPVANAADGTINFTGTILDTACTVDTGSATQTVPIGTVSKSAFTAPGSTAGGQAFTITVGSCNAAITRAAVRFDGPLDPVNPSLLKISDPTVAGIGIAIYEADSATLVPIATKSVGITAPATGASADLSFVAKYMATTAPAGITGGNGAASATFTMDYN